MDGILYIDLEQAKRIHQKTIQYSGGGTYEHFDLGRLESVLQNIQNDDYYPTFAEKLTHLFYCTCEFHCFADGNKRLAITLSAQFLLLNGYMGIAKNFFAVTEKMRKLIYPPKGKSDGYTMTKNEGETDEEFAERRKKASGSGAGQ